MIGAMSDDDDDDDDAMTMMRETVKIKADVENEITMMQM